MTQTIGTGWLIPPKRDPHDDAAFNQLISGMTTMDEVRPFMCPKSNGNPKKCEQCDGFRTCTAGQMAIRISTEETKPVYERKWTDEPKSLPNPAHKMNEEREEFIRACESGNAWNYLMETRHLTKNAAGEVLSRMVRQFPGLAADYGGSRRIMQRPKVVKITEIAPEKPRVDEKPASEPEVKETEGEKKQTVQETIHAGQRKGGAVIRERFMAIAKSAFDSGDPIEYLKRTEGSSDTRARARVLDWCKNYPELAGDYKPPETRRGRKTKAAKAQEDAESEFEILPPERDVNTDKTVRDDDEVSLAEFLSGFTFDEAEADRKEAELQPEEMPVIQEAPRAAQEAAGETDPMLATMNQRYEELKAEKERLRAEIQKAEDRIKCIEEQQDALAACLSAFRRASTATGRS